MAVSLEDARSELGIRVGWLLGRYLDDFDLLDAVVSDVLGQWVRLGSGADGTSVEQVWEDYVDSVESAVGGALCATDDDLRRVWLACAWGGPATDDPSMVRAPFAPYAQSGGGVFSQPSGQPYPRRRPVSGFTPLIGPPGLAQAS